ncbi:hypothetical protein HAX54_037203 [Datura stramonium]|uniref:Uncharacterized protein n=1 Tax=Datura stramonium TaxID=4076 RepID=A0ABS8VI36_DATST|nr:hypothetical protein [Datura stramonium]
MTKVWEQTSSLESLSYFQQPPTHSINPLISNKEGKRYHLISAIFLPLFLLTIAQNSHQIFFISFIR